MRKALKVSVGSQDYEYLRGSVINTPFLLDWAIFYLRRINFSAYVLFFKMAVK